jgi:hypothetical protein
MNCSNWERIESLPLDPLHPLHRQRAATGKELKVEWWIRFPTPIFSGSNWERIERNTAFGAASSRPHHTAATGKELKALYA